MDGTPIDREKLLSLTVGRGRRQPDRRDTREEWRDATGERHKAVTDELGNTVTQHARGDRQDVHIRAPHVRLRGNQGEER